MKQIEHINECLIRLTGYNGMEIDPGWIRLLDAQVNARPYRTSDGKEFNAKLVMETGSGNTYTIPCNDKNGAEQLKNTLAQLARQRRSKVRTRSSVDYTGTPMPGDSNYDSLRKSNGE